MSVWHTLLRALKFSQDNPAQNQFSKTSIGVLIAKASGLLTAFLVQIPLTRALGAESYGVYVFVLSWVAIASIIAGLGMDTTLVRYLPTYITEKKWGQLKGIVTFGFGGVLTACVLLTIIVYGTGLAFDARDLSFFAFVPVGAALLFVLAISQLVKATLRGLQRVLLTEILESIIRPLLLLAIFLLFFYGFSAIDAHLVMWANVLATLAVLTFLSLHLWRRLPAPVKGAQPDFSEWPEWIGLALPMILMAGISLLLNRTDIIMLGIIAGPAEAGIYAIGSRFAELATLGLVAVNTVLAPRISELFHSKQPEQLQNLLKAAAWFNLVFTVCVAVLLTVLGSFLLALFGEGFSGAYIPMLILLGGQMINALAGSVGYLMILTGRQNEAATVMFFVLILNIAGNFLLIPIYGMNGAAIATGISIVFWNVLLFVRVIRSLHLNPSVVPLRMLR
ncbi:MAG: flippase [Proteobacteria bacterium]|nr:flippase [Pseudomonadota bacterium]